MTIYNAEQKFRNTYIDNVKVVLLFLVVFAHILERFFICHYLFLYQDTYQKIQIDADKMHFQTFLYLILSLILYIQFL